MSMPKAIQDFVARFAENRDVYCSSEYNEMQLRREFLDPFFKTLGWDIDNEQGYAEAYKDVVHEDSIKVGRATKAPDYSFRIGGVRKFFVEAKRPSVGIKNDPDPAYQLRRYAWSAKLPLSILTDFEEFAVYDCRIKPNQNDSASVARVLYIRFDEYENRWDEIANIFSREAILKGSFDKYVESAKRKRGTAEVDTAFLKEIERWRDELARNIALRNIGLSNRELNFSVQRTIDRIIFLRICEDRGIETYGQLMALQNGENVYGRLCETFRRADERYNSGLFHFRVEKDRPGNPDDLTLGLTIDDRVLKGIFKSLYYPESPYEFSVLPANILGHIYEQFLGKVIRLTAGHRAVVEDKPEVKKAGGVYYTPTYIVDYIVEHTVGKLIESKTPKQVSKLRVLDPACGSGSFLLGAYQRLLDWHLARYSEHEPEKYAKGRKPKLFQGPGGDWRLTTAEKKRILLNNIYGVDIDPQAVEVTKLSLLLKVLEGENDETLVKHLRLFHERALPDLADNIKCGNSLIGPDFYEGQQISLLDAEEQYRINAFDWEAEFPEIMTDGGFDAVIGNPPYIRIQAMKEGAPIEVEFYKQRYIAASKGNYDIYVVFVERVLQLLNKAGHMGFILPHKFFQAKYGQSLRGLIAKGDHLGEVVHFGDQQIFAGASTYTCLLFLDKAGNKSFRYVKPHSLKAWHSDGEAVEGKILTDKVTEKEWNFVVGPEAKLLERLSEMPVGLGNVARIFVGTQTSADAIFVLDASSSHGDVVEGTSKITGERVQVEKEIVKPFLRGKDIRRYEQLEATASLICPYVIGTDDSRLMTEKELSSSYPLAHTYLESHKARLAAREKGRFKGTNWFAFGYPKSMTLFQCAKIVVPDYNNVASFAFDSHGHFYKTGYGIILRDEVGESPLYVLGLLNTQLLFRYLLHIGTTLRGGYVRFWTQFIEQLPIRTIDFSNPADKVRHDCMVEFVESMLKLHKDLQAAKTDHDKKLIQRQIDATDKQINQLVYELYSLTDKEIRIVEEVPK